MIFLFVAFLGYGTWIEAPHSEFDSMSQCRRAKIEVIRGMKDDAIDTYIIKCTRDPNFDYRTEL